MFFRRHERKRHPWLTLALCGISAVGAVAITSRCRCFISEKLSSISKMMKKSCPASEED